ncbi:MAG: hypothetical protein QOG09_1118 [Solirubrobacterales bacterium]|nr:hypothetical protein [Solirubrobacterales bacterium]MDX6652594.1 hypothetical protein [Solirubrobacterales bacterium]MDX6663016.1 hypothetical protein [Solirubrobacterales bacterium]
MLAASALPSATILLNARTFLGGIAVLVLMLFLTARLHRHPSRPCPNCDETVRLTSNRCANCGYRFALFQFRR